MNGNFSNGSESTQIQPTGALRILDGVLQQQFSLSYSILGVVERVDLEWRDVPQVTSEEK